MSTIARGRQALTGPDQRGRHRDVGDGPASPAAHHGKAGSVVRMGDTAIAGLPGKAPVKRGLKARAVGEAPIDLAAVRQAVAVLADPAHGFELRGLPSGRSYVKPGADVEAIARAAELLADDLNAEGICYALNPIRVGKDRAKAGTVLARRWFMVDIDPAKPEAHKNNPSTDAEHQLANRTALTARGYLSDLGWPLPLLIDSGNGWHLLYRIDLPNDRHSTALLKAILYDLGERLDGPDGTIDRAVHNASRIARLPGTRNRKGSASAERPHRWCRLIECPESPVVDSVEALHAASNQKPSPEQRPTAEQARPLGLRAKALGPSDAWARSALQQELGKVAMATAPGRNNQLNASAYSLGQIIAGGALEQGEVEAKLTEAAVRNGLVRDDGPASVAATIKSGFDAGAEEPRPAPEANGLMKHGVKEKAASEGKDKPSVPVIILGSAITPRTVSWLWRWRIPLGKLTTFAGVGGLGKTFVLCDITARITRGGAWPDSAGECCEPGRVLFVSGEDDADDTLVPRLLELGADLDRVGFLTTEALGRFTLADLPLLTQAVEELGRADGPPVRFVAIDPPTAYLNGIDDHKNGDLRQLLTPLKIWAAKHQVALVFNTHINKGGAGKVDAMMRVMGSVAWVNAVRAAYLFARDPDDPERRLFLPMKQNLSRERKGLAYRIAERPDEQAAVEWLGEVETTADQAVSRPDAKPKRGEAAKEWLIDRFREKREWPSEYLFKAAKENGISKNAIYEAKDLLCLPKARKITREHGEVEWVWWIPPDWPQLARTPTPITTPGDLGELDESSF